jgi:hypothetical protein
VCVCVCMGDVVCACEMLRVCVLMCVRMHVCRWTNVVTDPVGDSAVKRTTCELDCHAVIPQAPFISDTYMLNTPSTFLWRGPYVARGQCLNPRTRTEQERVK